MPRSLGITFATPEDLESEYGTNIANGGIFLASEESFSLRERVCVEIGLPFCSERLQLQGEVVHRIPPELASSGRRDAMELRLRSR